MGPVKQTKLLCRESLVVLIPNTKTGHLSKQESCELEGSHPHLTSTATHLHSIKTVKETERAGRGRL